MPRDEIFGMVDRTIDTEAIGIIEGAGIGATEGGWEGIAAGAFEGAAELDVTTVTKLTVMGNAELDLPGKTEEGTTTIPSIQFQMPQRHADTKWTMKPTHTEDQGTQSRTTGNLIWNRPT
jgi:hypothetical protein